MAPLRGPSSHERLWLASGCPFASPACDAARGSRKVILFLARGVYTTYGGGGADFYADASVFIELVRRLEKKEPLANFWTVHTC